MQFVMGENYSTEQIGRQKTKKWEVNYFLKNVGQLFFGVIDPEVVAQWLDKLHAICG